MGMGYFSDLFIDNSFSSFTKLMSKLNLRTTGLFRHSNPNELL